MISSDTSVCSGTLYTTQKRCWSFLFPPSGVHGFSFVFLFVSVFSSSGTKNAGVLT